MKKYVSLPGTFFCALVLVSLPVLLRAQSVDSITQAEVARRQARVPQGEQALAGGHAELRARQYAQGHEDFRAALNSLPTGSRSYRRALDGFCDSGVKLAQQRMAEGQSAQARVVLNEILSDRYNPNCR